MVVFEEQKGPEETDVLSILWKIGTVFMLNSWSIAVVLFQTASIGDHLLVIMAGRISTMGAMAYQRSADITLLRPTPLCKRKICSKCAFSLFYFFLASLWKA